MSRTIPTTIAPFPDDYRVVHLGQLLNVSKSQAVGVVVIAWRWLHDEQKDELFVPGSPDMLDTVTDMTGAGQALVDAGLIGVSPDGVVLPLGLRREVDRAKGRNESPQDRRRRKDAERKAKSRRNQRLRKPTPKATSPAPVGEDTGPKRTPRRLGTVDGFPVMLLWSRAGVPFYKLAGASPKEWTGTATDQDSPSYADALVALHAAMKREDSKGLGSADTFRPSMSAVVAAAERYRADRESAAADAARRDEANQAFAEASAEDQDDVAGCDLSRPCPHVTADTVTSPHPCPQSGHSGVVVSPCGCQDLDAESCPHECPQSGHNAAPSSSSSSAVSGYSGQSSKYTTTTTSGVTPAKRDHEDDILDRFVPRKDPVVEERERKRQEVAVRFAAALNTTVESVIHQWRTKPDTLRARLLAAGVDPNTGQRVANEAPDEPAGARDDIGVTTEASVDDMPVTGSVGARGDDEPDEDFDQQRVRLVEQLRKVAVTAAADIGVKYA